MRAGEWVLRNDTGVFRRKLWMGVLGLPSMFKVMEGVVAVIKAKRG
jgi:hypothetical protein